VTSELAAVVDENAVDEAGCCCWDSTMAATVELDPFFSGLLSTSPICGMLTTELLDEIGGDDVFVLRTRTVSGKLYGVNSC
jgi:hypothetical protein